MIGSRTTESFVSVNSGEIVVLGGLQRKSQIRSTSRLGGSPSSAISSAPESAKIPAPTSSFSSVPYVLTNTPVDNAEAMARLQGSPQVKDVQSALSGHLPVKP